MALSDNLLLGVVNRLDTAASVTVGSSVATFPATNLKTADLTRPYRTGGVTAPTTTGRDVTAGRTWLEVDLGQGYLLQMLALVQHTLSQSATFRVRLSNDSTWAAADVYDSGYVAAWPQVTTFGAQDWGVFTWGGALATVDAAFYTISSFHLLATPVSARYLRLELSDATNSAGFLQIGRMFLGPVWQPTLNMDLDWSIGWEDPSEVARSIGGTITVDPRPRYRVATFTLAHIPETEALGNISDYLDRRKGTTGDLVLIPQPTKPETWVHEAMYGRQRRLDPLRSPYVDFRRARGFEIEEMR